MLYYTYLYIAHREGMRDPWAPSQICHRFTMPKRSSRTLSKICLRKSEKASWVAICCNTPLIEKWHSWWLLGAAFCSQPITSNTSLKLMSQWQKAGQRHQYTCPSIWWSLRQWCSVDGLLFSTFVNVISKPRNIQMSRRVDQYVSQKAILYNLLLHGAWGNHNLNTPNFILWATGKGMKSKDSEWQVHWRSLEVGSANSSSGEGPRVEFQSRHYKNKHVLHDCASPKKYHPWWP